MRRVLLLVFFSIACRSQPDPGAATPVPLPTASAPTKRVCEPTVTCGMWSKCAWLELDHVEPTHEVYRLAGGTPSAHYSRVHQCWPEDAGRNGCSLYCDLKGACVDGLASDEPCTGAATPRPSPYVCEVRGAECVTEP